MAHETKFDEEAARRVEALYQTPDVMAQRREVLRALALAPGERALDIGSGPGLLAVEMGEAVGKGGRVDGVDLSEPMIAMGRARAAAMTWIGFHTGDAAELPFPDDSFDAAAATQIYLYVRDLPRALRELKRVLKPGARALVLDTDWDSAVWHSEDRPRMARVLQAWEAHFGDAHVASKMPAALLGAGFAVERQSVLTLLNPRYEEASYSAGMIPMIKTFVARHGIDPAEAEAWADELRARGRDGSYFFSLNRYLFLARKKS